MKLVRLLGMEATYSRAKLGGVLATTALYLTLAVVRGPDAGSILMLVTIPVVLAAWSFGVRAAIFASAVGFLMNGVIAMAVAGEDLRTWLSVSGLLGTSVLLVAGVTVGRLRDLGGRLERELTERAAMQDARRLLAEVATNMAEGVYLIRASDGVIVYANERFEEMFGYLAGELIGEHVSVVNAPSEKSPEETAQEIIDALNATGTWRGEIRNVKKDGTPFWCHASVSTFEHHEHGAVWVSVHQDINEQKLAEEELRESEERYRALFESAPVGIAVTEARGTMTQTNPALEEMLGRTGEELRGSRLREFRADGSGAPSTHVSTRLAVGKRETLRYERQLLHSSGEVIWAQITATRTPVQAGQPERVFRVFEDITERKRAEEALRESEERYRALFESAPVGIAITDASGIIVQTNSALERIFGRTQDELNGSQLRDFRPDGSPAPSENIFTRLASAETGTLRYERQLLHSSGETVWAHVTATAAPAQADQPERVFRMFEDITEQKRAEEALREGEERYRALFESAPIGIAISGEAGLIVQTNPALEKMLGRTGEELRGSRLRDFTLGAGAEGASRVFDRLPNGEPDTARYDRQFVHANGDIVWTHMTAATIPGHGGQPKYAFRMIEDITERRKAERALQEAEAEHLDRTRHLASIGQLAAGVAHEINNPLNSVMGFTQLVLAEESLSEQARSDLETVYGESQRASKIVENLLSFARKREPERRPVDVRSVVERACHLKEYDLRKHAIELRTHFPEELSLVLGDEQQLTEVLLNLLTNAEQAIASTEQPGVVTVACESSDGLVQITVADDGPGIPPEILGRIFEPFFTTKDVGGGTGLGLSVCQGIIREHEGELWAESTLGGDTTFSITLPVPHAPLTPSPTPEAEPQLRPVASMRVLVVDDEPKTRHLMVRALAQDKHTVEEASDGNDAWRKIRGTTYDCVIVDLRMPGLAGQELYHLVEESYPDLAARFIFVTGDTMSPDTDGFLSSVAGPALMKPIDITELRQRVAALQETGARPRGRGRRKEAR